MKKVLITGANKGIGLETARQLAGLGYFVYLGSRDQEKGFEALHRLQDEGFTHVDLLQIDVSNASSVQQAASELESRTEVLDVLINNAAIAGPKQQTFSKCDVRDMKDLFDTNFFGPIQTAQAFLSLLKKSESPVIVNVSSELGSLTMHSDENKMGNWDDYNVYASSKVSLNAFTVMLANGLKNSNFRVNSVTPGYTATDLNDHQGFKSVGEGAKAIVDCVISEDAVSGSFYSDHGIVPW